MCQFTLYAAVYASFYRSVSYRKQQTLYQTDENLHTQKY